MKYTFGQKFETPEGFVLHACGMPSPGLDAYVGTVVPKWMQPAMASSFMPVGTGPNTATGPLVAKWLSWNPPLGRMPHLGLAFHDVNPATYAETSNLAAILAGERNAQILPIADAIGAYGFPVMVRLQFEATSAHNKYERSLYAAAYNYVATILRERAPNCSLVFCIEPGAPDDLWTAWCPDLRFVDAFGIDMFEPSNLSGPLVDGRGDSTQYGRAQAFAAFARAAGRPLIIPEASAVGKGFTLGTTEEDADRAWTTWFIPLQEYMAEHNVGLLCYLSNDWKASANGWSSGRLDLNPYIAARWLQWMGNGKWIHAPYSWVVNGASDVIFAALAKKQPAP